MLAPLLFFLAPQWPNVFSSRIATGYGYLLKLKAALPHPLVIKIVASYRYRSICCTLKKPLVLFYWRRIYFEKFNLEMFFEKVENKKKRDLKK